MTARFACIVLAVVVAATTPSIAQVPHISVYTDPGLNDYYAHCGAANTMSELFVVLRNANMIVSAVDFSIDYPLVMSWLYDQLPYSWMVNNEVVTIGNSRDGIAIAWGVPWMEDGSQGPILLLRPVVYWGPACTCDDPPEGYIRVRGYAPLGKTQPSMIRYPDFVEFTAIGGSTPWCYDQLPTEPATWGRVKALYRN